MARSGEDSGGESDDIHQSKALRLQKKLCDEGMELVNAGVAMQNATPPDLVGAEEKLTRAVTIMEKALAIEYPNQEERDASQRLNNKMNRYVKMIRSQREKGTASGPGGQKLVKYNILEMDKLPQMYNPIVQLLNKYVNGFFLGTTVACLSTHSVLCVLLPATTARLPSATSLTA